MVGDNEIKRIRTISLFFIFLNIISLVLVVYSVYLPFFTIKGHSLSFYDYTLKIYQDMPLAITALLTECVVLILLLPAFVGIFQFKEKARKSLIFISICGLVVYIVVSVYSKISGQKLPLPVKECLILLVLIFVFTKQKVREQFS